MRNHVESREILHRFRKIMSVYYVSNICPKDYMCVGVHTHTHTYTSQITKGKYESNILLQHFLLDIAKLHNFFSSECIERRTGKRNIFLSVTYYVEKNFRHSAIGCRCIAAKDIYDEESIYLEYRYFALEHSVQSTFFFCLSDDCILKNNLAGLFQKVIKISIKNH